jgi:hypothetical protein
MILDTENNVPTLSVPQLYSELVCSSFSDYESRSGFAGWLKLRPRSVPLSDQLWWLTNFFNYDVGSPFQQGCQFLGFVEFIDRGFCPYDLVNYKRASLELVFMMQ